MSHIRIWPPELNDPHQNDMFEERVKEWEFWGHLYKCSKCRNKLVDYYRENTELVERGFWTELKKYLGQEHPDIIDFRQRIVEQASLDILMKPSVEMYVAFADKYQHVQHHLLICSMCCRRYETIEERLANHDDTVRAAYEMWQAPS